MALLHETIIDLSLDDLRVWAGSKILNRGKSYQSQVDDLVRLEDGGLLATVSGTDEYETWVGADEDGELDCYCTCPYDWGPCKHGVAVILKGLAMVKAGVEVPLADPDDERRVLASEDLYDDEDDDYDECGHFIDVETAVKPILNKKKKAELLTMLLDLARRFPEVRRDILETEQLQSGDVEKLVCSLAAEIDEVTQEDAYYNHWRDEGSLPDYSHIQQQLAALLAKGHADEVVKLGQQLWEQGCEQVGQSHDDGETAMEVAGCMDIIFEAVEASSMPASDQILWFIDVFLEDEYSICDHGRDYIDSASYGQNHWQETVIALQARLGKTPKPKGDDFSSRYQREKVMNWLIIALERSGQQEHVLPLLEREAHTLQCYGRLVDLLLAEGRVDEARKWCVNGYERTRNNAAGIAARLQERLRELARQEKNPQLVAAYRAQDFFVSPSLKTYQDLQKACEAADCWPTVHGAVVLYLEKGTRPEASTTKIGWPLPAPEVETAKGNRFKTDFPIYGVLIDIAIYEKRLDDVVSLYQKQSSRNSWHNNRDEEVAKAVAVSHPEVALAIWHKLAMGQIAQVKPSAYGVAASYLGKMRQVYQQTKQLAKWQNLIFDIRTEHKRKRRLLEVLDSLEGKRLID